MTFIIYFFYILIYNLFNNKFLIKKDKKMAKIILDTIVENDGTFEINFGDWLKEVNIEAKIIEQVGPAGNWPIIEYSGQFEALKIMVIEFFGDSELLEYIEI